MANLSVSGAVSGIDTASLINSLVQAQSNQQILLKNRKSSTQTAASALSQITAALSTVGGLAGTLARTSDWAGSTATSSSASVTASATGTASGSLTFDVTSLAAAHALVSAEAVSSMGTVVASGPLTLTKSDGTTAQIAVGTGSLADVVAGINAAGQGITATAVQTSPAQYRLQVTSTSTGATSRFGLAGLTGFTAMNTLTQGADAAVTVGSDPATAYRVTSSTNTFAGLVPGLSFTVSKVESGVTVRSSVDGTQVAGQVSKLVDALNAVLSKISAQTAYDATKKTAGPLMSDPTVRSLQQQLLNLVSGAGAAGVSLSRDGTVTFDSAAFTAAFTADPGKVKAAFGATTTFAPAAGVTGSIAYSSSTSATAAGTYAVHVGSLAAREQWSLGSSFTAGQVVHLTRGTAGVSYTVQAGDGATQVAAGLGSAAAAASFGVTASQDGSGNLLLTADSLGSAAAFTADVNGTSGSRLSAGADVIGTIGGQTAPGVGSVLALATGTGGAVGLAVDTAGLTAGDVATAAGNVGNVTYKPGLAQNLTALVAKLTNSTTGSLSTAQQTYQSQIKSLQNSIDGWDTRLAAYRASLTTRFTAMETALAALKSQTTAISGLSTRMLGSSGSSSN
jgi:flagellar hook-associated protein 2